MNPLRKDLTLSNGRIHVDYHLAKTNLLVFPVKQSINHTTHMKTGTLSIAFTKAQPVGVIIEDEMLILNT